MLSAVLKSLFGKDRVNGVDLKGEGKGFLQICNQIDALEVNGL